MRKDHYEKINFHNIINAFYINRLYRICGVRWVPTAGMNEHGLFSSLQYQCPMIEGTPVPSPDQLYIYQLFSTAINDYSSVIELECIIDLVELINLYDLTLHTLIADPSGNALIAEAGDGENLITGIKNMEIELLSPRV